MSIVAEKAPAGSLAPAVVKQPNWMVSNWGLLLAVVALVAILLLPTASIWNVVLGATYWRWLGYV